ncbi:siderophore-interacting protein [Streptomyces sp. NPDC049954]|uniref:siderophore-interacting protein n=1 Tax=Streptomyces sp. NPDC049954 TaxID=3155779 RepID=UPI003418F7A2
MRRTERLSPSLLRVRLGAPPGPVPAGCAPVGGFASGGRDQSLSLFLPHPGQREPVVPAEAGEGWFAAWRELPEDVRAVMRSYTLRGRRVTPEGGTEIDIDFALHGDGGPASRWAASAVAGDRVLVLGPAIRDNSAVRFRPPAEADSLVLWADETALPAAAAILEALPPGLPADVWIEVGDEAGRIPLTTAADARVTWLPRTTPGTPDSLAALRAHRLRGTAPYAWIAGESGTVRALRRHLVRERGLDRRSVTFTGYWKRGMSEEQLRASAVRQETD